jgi:hypothetical protein
MNKAQIDSILDRVRTWPEERQEDAARILLAMEGQDTGIYRLSDQERAEIRAALEEIERGEGCERGGSGGGLQSPRLALDFWRRRRVTAAA